MELVESIKVETSDMMVDERGVKDVVERENEDATGRSACAERTAARSFMVSLLSVKAGIYDDPI